MSTITVKDGTTIFRAVSLPHIRIWPTADLLMFWQEANRRSRDRDAIRP